jgi:site-specific DNA recombinase
MIKVRKAIIMARVSSDEQAKGYSLDIQEDSIRKWCADREITIIKCFREDHSAKDFNRPQWKELKTYAKSQHKNIDMLLVTTWDRFSRNTTDAFNELYDFKKLAIEVQSIQQPIDFNIPESKVLLAIYLTLPEVDNDRRSMKIKEGMRAALKSGRWSRAAPIGYINTRDESNKPLIIPGDKAELIRHGFEEVSKGFSQQYVIKQLRKKGLDVSRNNFSLLLRSPIYIGKIRIPACEDEPEEIIDGLHDGIVSLELFYKVQQLLNDGYKHRNRKKQNSTKEELPLRGILFCSSCGSKITGSASKSKTGAKHYYYHCNYCKKERFRADVANKSIEDFLDELNFEPSIMHIYEDMINTISNDNSKEKLVPVNIENVKNKIKALLSRIDKLQDLLIDEVLSVADYTKKKDQYQSELDELNIVLKPKPVLNSDLKDKLERGINLLVNAKKIYIKADVLGKQRLLSSIFPEKLEFSDNKCRTPRINNLLLLMLLKYRGIGDQKTGQLFGNLELSRRVESPGIEPKPGNPHQC